ncbi:hypothetical protein AXG93_2865s1050 [Marchantia polymorpha subsp. ruderalis]|uniref:Protein kinase domain-containing protein n=2 Tax=Marchantia polymorpha TaxID=3197 RepID=A0A176W6P8_MARPO|nr:hypothetical protein AXG93_2865s1050 [Marchantia polymorpha subsp. ruderalis]
MLFCSLLLMHTWNANAALSAEEETTLELVRDHFGLPNWTGDPCITLDWIKCSNTSTTSTTTNVWTINLTEKNLTGQLPASITQLRQLRELIVYQNDLVGPVPDLSNLTFLTFLDLSENNFTGPIPDTTAFTNLSQIIVSGNKFSDGFPASLFNHTTIRKIMSNNNPIGGPVPDFSGVTSIRELYFAMTQVVGSIPASMGNLTQTTHIEFHNNPNISGVLPNLTGFLSLQYWDASNCDLSGPLPDFRNAGGLIKAAFTNNNFNGTIAPAFFQHDKIRWVNLDSNPQLTGEVPDVGLLTSVEVFSINNCNLTGLLPSFKNNTKLMYLNLWNNRFTGFSDPDFSHITTLVVLDAQNNSMTGSLPEVPPSSSQIKTSERFLQKLRLNNNSFSGEIPKSWFNLSFTEILRLDRNNLSGVIPKEIGNLTDLQTLNLANNFFSGPIPEEIGLLTGLQTLDLRNNSFSGTVPESLALIPNLTRVWLDNNNFTAIPQALITKLGANVTFANNTNIQILTSSTSSSGLSTGGIVGVVIGAIVAGIAVLSILLYIHKRRHADDLSREDMPKSAKFFRLKDIKKMTCNYKTLIGKGGFGSVYHGKLSDGKEVAVKVRAADSKQGVGEFLNEVRLLSRLHHRNLVPLVGYCLESRQQILVYDYMSQGTLNDHLHHAGTLPYTSETASADQSTTRPPLSWKTRIEIAIGSARGLEYLHKDCNPPVIHRDVKSSNILLGDKLQAKVTDLGISKQVPELATDDMEQHTMSGVSTAIKGTIGYLDPEYFVRRKLTTKSDVFSFGIVLLEIITGKRPHSVDFSLSDDTNLNDWVRDAVDMDEVDRIVDPALKGGYDEEGMRKVAVCAVQCIAPSGGERPDMGEIVNVLTEALQLEGGQVDPPVDGNPADVHRKFIDDDSVPFSGQLGVPLKPKPVDEVDPTDLSDVSYPTQSTKSYGP